MNLIVNVNIPTGWGIGASGQLLSHISADMKRFAALTTGQVVVYGRKTLETFPGGRPLKNRTNLILSTAPAFAVEGAQVVPSLDALREVCRIYPSEKIWVIGGESVYRALLPYCAHACITKSYEPLTGADAFFPDLDALPDWRATDEGPMQEENGKQYQFVDYENTACMLF